ncbi:MAG: ribulose 1,5-bisphosphate carboxylase [Rhodospirillales bacterium]|nr:ribulose 1,5-bisphosphate carboxylase [Rhodospirillales bacterium]
MGQRLVAIYRIRTTAAAIASRAAAIAVEQSVEMPVAAIDAPRILTEVVGRVEAIVDRGGGVFDARIGLAAETVGADAGQLLNMLFGNSSLQPDVTLIGAELPAALARRFGGPRHGIAGLRARLGVGARALTGSALKPQGLPADRLARLAEDFARGGIDLVKDDHGLADQDAAPFAARVPAIAQAVRRAAATTGHPTRYAPSLSGHHGQMRAQLILAREEGLDTALLAPMVAGFAAVQALGAEFPDFAFLAHPAMGGAARIAPDFLIGALFPLIGADAVIFPAHGGRFGYSAATCRGLAEAARHPANGLRPALPVPAGGMTLGRVSEILDFFGPDTMLLIGGSLLEAGAGLTEATARFAAAVAAHKFDRETGSP